MAPAWTMSARDDLGGPLVFQTLRTWAHPCAALRLESLARQRLTPSAHNSLAARFCWLAILLRRRDTNHWQTMSLGAERKCTIVRRHHQIDLCHLFPEQGRRKVDRT
jgi:hypothetical protein